MGEGRRVGLGGARGWGRRVGWERDVGLGGRGREQRDEGWVEEGGSRGTRAGWKREGAGHHGSRPCSHITTEPMVIVVREMFLSDIVSPLVNSILSAGTRDRPDNFHHNTVVFLEVEVGGSLEINMFPGLLLLFQERSSTMVRLFIV